MSNMKTNPRGKNRPGRSHQPSLQQILDRASAALARGENRSALAQLENAVELDPSNPRARHLLGESQARTGQFEEAIRNLSQAVAADEGNADYQVALAEALMSSRPQDAIPHFVKAIQMGYAKPYAYCDLACILLDSHRDEEALQVSDLGLRVCPENADILSNRAIALLRLGAYEDALSCALRVRALRPNEARALSNLSNITREMGRLEEAEKFAREACALDAGSGDAHYSLALALLIAGKYREGFPEYEWRWHSKVMKDKPRQLQKPLWDGSALEGKRILVYAEQGAGDIIQFVRYVPLVTRAGGQMILEVPSGMQRLIGWMPGAFTIVCQEPAPNSFDVQCPLLSLAKLFTRDETSIPPPASFSIPEEMRAKWAERLGARGQPKVALVWAGRPTHDNDRNRSMSLNALLPIFNLANVGFFSLQVGPAARQIGELGLASRLEDLSPVLTDYAETAAALSQMDLVVTVDTSVAHLAGSLGKPVWMLVPFAPDWRWQLGRNDSPWYPSMRLFRQKTPKVWHTVVDEIAAELPKFLGAPNTPAARAVLPGATDTERWSNSANLEASWNARAKLAADFIPAGATVLDLGCGAMALETFLPPGCRYIPCDLVARDERTIVCNFNEQPIPSVPDTTHITFLGVLEYIHDWRGFLGQLRAKGVPVIFSYCPADFTTHLDRASLGWVNHLSVNELSAGLNEAAFSVQSSMRPDSNQVLIRAIPEQRLRHKMPRILVLSYSNVGNFGDRLGFHLINSVLPAYSEVHYASFKPWDIPAGDFDLLILGIGNSVFEPILTDELVSLVRRVPRSVGIFGTQYREEINRERLSQLLDALTVWFARYEEDVLLYGKSRKNTIHLGDWLVSAFPMSRWKRDDTLRIGKEIWNDLPLDRTIQAIQQYRNVVSERLHPLLCALTSAERVAYTEQRESGSGRASGKFRGMLIDIFGRAWPESSTFEPDREAVAAYRARVQRVMSAMPQLFSELLGIMP